MNARKEIWAYPGSLIYAEEKRDHAVKYINAANLQDPAFLAKNGLCSVEDCKSFLVTIPVNEETDKMIDEYFAGLTRKPSPPEERE